MYKFFTYLAKLSLYISFWFLVVASKCIGLKAMYKLHELDDDEGFDVYFRYLNKEK